jgi:hypothetical protein
MLERTIRVGPGAMARRGDSRLVVVAVVAMLRSCRTGVR